MKQAEFMKFAKKPENPIIDVDAAFHKSEGVIDLMAVDGRKQSLMDYAALQGNLKLAIWLALNGININTQNAGKTPVFRAMEKKHIDLAIFLLLLGCDLNLRTKTGKNVFNLPGYTVDLEHQHNIRLLKDHYTQGMALLTDASLDLAKYPAWVQSAPLLLGLMGEITRATSYKNFNEFCLRHVLLKTVAQAIERNEALRSISADVVLHTAPKSKEITSAREVTRAYSNLTPGIAIGHETRALLHIASNPKTHIRSLKDAIFFHAQLRIQFAFYLFVAYYNTRIHIHLDDTRTQEGQGESAINTVACHSALISHVTEVHRWKAGLEVHAGTRESRSNSESLKKCHLSEKCSFSQIMGKTTVELPSAVNQHDATLEGKTTKGGAKNGRLTLLELLQKVALGELNPIQGLEQFLTAMIELNGILGQIFSSGYLRENCSTSPQKMRPLIHRYVFLATLSPLQRMSDNKFHLKRTHVANLLFMKPEDRRSIADCDEASLARVCEPYFTSLQTEILSN